jgi:pimeloyl-ACP methyl ester carboxylesterase
VGVLSQITLKKVELKNGETLGYREREGGAEVILLVHGNMTSSKHWDLLMENMSPKFKVYAVDLRGFGISTYKKPINSLKDFADDLKLFVDALQLSEFSLVGWSTGGGVGMQFAANHPSYVQKLVLIASVSTRGYPFFKADETGQPILSERLRTKKEISEDPAKTIPVLTAYGSKNKDFLRALWNMAIYTHHQPIAERYEEYLEDMLTQRNLVDVYHALNTFNISRQHNGLSEGTRDAEKIQAPTLVLQGKKDHVVLPTMAEEIMEDLGEQAKLTYFENCGHSPLVDDLDQLLEAVTEFLQKNKD